MQIPDHLFSSIVSNDPGSAILCWFRTLLGIRAAVPHRPPAHVVKLRDNPAVINPTTLEMQQFPPRPAI